MNKIICYGYLCHLYKPFDKDGPFRGQVCPQILFYFCNKAAFLNEIDLCLYLSIPIVQLDHSIFAILILSVVYR